MRRCWLTSAAVSAQLCGSGAFPASCNSPIMGKNWTSWAAGRSRWPRREPGSRAYLKNYRKGLHHQWERAWSAVQDLPKGDARDAAQDRLNWVLAKQDALDDKDVMFFDAPVTQKGGQMRFADLKSTAARRRLTQQEVLWNKELIEEEWGEALHRPACVATPATPAPDTAPCKTKRGEANAAPMRVGPSPTEGSLAITASNASEGCGIFQTTTPSTTMSSPCDSEGSSQCPERPRDASNGCYRPTSSTAGGCNSCDWWICVGSHTSGASQPGGGNCTCGYLSLIHLGTRRRGS